MLSELDAKERRLLLKFVCAFAWSDLAVQSAERQFVKKLAKRLGLSAEEWAEVAVWLEEPPSPEEVDPDKVPRQHRELFLRTVRQLIQTDGVVAEHEAELYETLEDLLA